MENPYGDDTFKWSASLLRERIFHTFRSSLSLCCSRRSSSVFSCCLLQHVLRVRDQRYVKWRRHFSFFWKTKTFLNVKLIFFFCAERCRTNRTRLLNVLDGEDEKFVYPDGMTNSIFHFTSWEFLTHLARARERVRMRRIDFSSRCKCCGLESVD